MALVVPPVFFVSYARADAEYPDDRANLKKFVEDLSARVAVKMPTPRESVSFMDEPNIQVGEIWSDSLGEALKRCHVGVAFYSPNYFVRPWCGKEFQVFLNRSRPTEGGTGIVPVRWEKFPNPPVSAARIQYVNDALPPEYNSMGMSQLTRLKMAFPAAYEFAISALSDRIITEAKSQRLAPFANLDFSLVESAWSKDASNDVKSHTRGNVSKTCFVFVSSDGWSWAPYEGNATQIGALAQKISGELGLKYEEIPCDDALPEKLRETNHGDVPTILFGDPNSLSKEHYLGPMRAIRFPVPSELRRTPGMGTRRKGQY